MALGSSGIVIVEESRAEIVLETLVESGLAEALGNGRGRNYMLSSKFCSAYSAVPVSVALLEKPAGNHCI